MLFCVFGEDSEVIYIFVALFFFPFSLGGGFVFVGDGGGAQKSCTEGAKRQMDIGVVLARASELHAKISDAIERAMRYEFLQSTSRAGLRRSPNTGVAEVVAVENGLSSPSSSAGFDSKEYDSDSYDRGGGGGLPAVAAPSGAGDVNAEARSLSAIRDALEVLEEQLEALQVREMRDHFVIPLRLFVEVFFSLHYHSQGLS